jgi:mannitol-1-/sugar-/sorbitol-6-phosphatase
MTISQQSKLSISVRAVLFDMDGVLISSIGSDERSWTRWATLHGMEKTFSVRSTHGRRTIDTIRALRPDLDPVIETRRLEDFDAEDGAGLTILPGVQDLLAKLPPSQWSIVTSASERIMRHRLQILGLPISPKIVTAEKVSHGKPNPEPYQLGAQQLGLSPADCLVIEDSPSGIRAGKEAGCRVLAVLSSHPPGELREADWIVNSLEDIQANPSDNGWITCHLKVVAENVGALKRTPRAPHL